MLPRRLSSSFAVFFYSSNTTHRVLATLYCTTTPLNSASALVLAVLNLSPFQLLSLRNSRTVSLPPVTNGASNLWLSHVFAPPPIFPLHRLSHHPSRQPARPRSPLLLLQHGPGDLTQCILQTVPFSASFCRLPLFPIHSILVSPHHSYKHMRHYSTYILLGKNLTADHLSSHNNRQTTIHHHQPTQFL